MTNTEFEIKLCKELSDMAMSVRSMSTPDEIISAAYKLDICWAIKQVLLDEDNQGLAAKVERRFGKHTLVLESLYALWLDSSFQTDTNETIKNFIAEGF